MKEKIFENTRFLTNVILTLCTIIVGLISFILYSENISSKKEPKRCEYNGWAYADGEIYDSEDGCNSCFCNDGNTVCTEKACN